MLGGQVVHLEERPAVSGTVMFIGPGPRCESCGSRVRGDLVVGDRVIFASNRGSEVTMDGETYLAIDQDDILAIVEEE